MQQQAIRAVHSPPLRSFTNAYLNGTYSFNGAARRLERISGHSLLAGPASRKTGVSYHAAAIGRRHRCLEPKLTCAVIRREATRSKRMDEALTLLFHGRVQMSIALNSGNAGVMIQIDLNATSSGSFRVKLQRCSRNAHRGTVFV